MVRRYYDRLGRYRGQSRGSNEGWKPRSRLGKLVQWIGTLAILYYALKTMGWFG